MMLASDSLFRTAAVTGVDSLYDEDVAGWNGAAVARSSLIIARRPLPRSSGVGAKSLAPPKLSIQTSFYVSIFCCKRKNSAAITTGAL
jgi:hypothetical protein